MTRLEVYKSVKLAELKAFFYATFHPGCYIRIEMDIRGKCGINYTELVTFIGVVDALQNSVIRAYYGESKLNE